MEHFAYRFEEEELASVVAGWPSGVGVALCMSGSGRICLALYRTKDSDDVLTRIVEASGWPLGAFSVSPKMSGVRTIRVTFSEAQRFLRIVEEVEGLLPMAKDFLRESAQRAPVPKTRSEAPTLEKKVRGTASSAPWRPRISLRTPSSGMPHGFRSAGEFVDGPVAVLPAEIRTSGARVRVLIQPGALESHDLPLRAQDVGHRDDLRCFVFGPECLREWHPGRGMIIDAKMEAFPRALVERFQSRVHKAEVSITPSGIFVTPAEPAGEALVAPPRVQAPKSRGRGFGLKFGLLTLVAAGLISGGVTALQSGVAPRAISLAYKAGEGNTALNVVRSIAGGGANSSTK
ncbi:hypothetical protein [Roseivivax sp. CAU 1753]